MGARLAGKDIHIAHHPGKPNCEARYGAAQGRNADLILKSTYAHQHGWLRLGRIDIKPWRRHFRLPMDTASCVMVWPHFSEV
mmetsp:Transcript_90626/g.202501  ORF Transcript_90626/g.202501 Transcript_90626/m.202501 type:complete len:82 (+) Transcript_90626:2-247(+)